MTSRYYWVRVKPEWKRSGWLIGLRREHEFDGRKYQWEILIPGLGVTYHAYGVEIEEVGPRIPYPKRTKP